MSDPTNGELYHVDTFKVFPPWFSVVTLNTKLLSVFNATVAAPPFAKLKLPAGLTVPGAPAWL